MEKAGKHYNRCRGKSNTSSAGSKRNSYFITAEKQINNNGTESTAISAAYANVTVVPDEDDKGDYINGVELCIKNSKTEVKKNLLIFLMDLRHLLFQQDSVMASFM